MRLIRAISLVDGLEVRSPVGDTRNPEMRKACQEQKMELRQLVEWLHEGTFATACPRSSAGDSWIWESSCRISQLSPGC